MNRGALIVVVCVVAVLVGLVHGFSALPRGCSVTRNALVGSKVAGIQTNRLARKEVLRMGKEDEDLKRMYRSLRQPQAGDRVVELRKPLGLVLKEDEKGNVYVEEVVKGGNAEKSGKIKEGDQVVMCSATFGDELWSTRGVGLDSVMKALRIRSGYTTKLVLEDKGESASKKLNSLFSFNKKKEQEEEKERKKDEALKAKLASEIEEETKNRKKFFGLF